jgi:uncharacterized protein YbjQ (UPF0145 family)
VSSVDFGINIGIPLFLLVVTYFIGSGLERRHYDEIRRRETELRALPAVSLQAPPDDWEIEGAGLVTGSVVISVDYFKRFLSGLRGLVGGRVKSYETLLDRARRESVLRLKESARESGYRAIINVRLETSRLASGRRDGKGTAGVEILAFGTGLTLRRDP